MAEEKSVRDARAEFADVINDAVQGRITYITSRGRRVAAVVPVVEAEKIETRRESGQGG